jgi:hypothetical protein
VSVLYFYCLKLPGITFKYNKCFKLLDDLTGNTLSQKPITKLEGWLYHSSKHKALRFKPQIHPNKKKKKNCQLASFSFILHALIR